MCEAREIRYVHVMEHPDYPEPLECGCVCAGKMEESRARAEQREKVVRDEAGRRARFPDRKRWRVSRRGTPYIKTDGYHIMVVRRPGGYGVGITPLGAGPEKTTWGPRTYATEREARLGCFDALVFMTTGRPPGGWRQRPKRSKVVPPPPRHELTDEERREMDPFADAQQEETPDA